MSAGTIRIAIDASSALAGGGLTYLRELLPRLSERSDVAIAALLMRSDVPPDVHLLARSLDCPLVVSPWRFAHLSRGWLQLVASSEPHVVYAPTEIALGSYTVPVVLALRSPFFGSTALEGAPLRTRGRVAAQRLLAKISSTQAAGYIAVSEYARETAVEALGIDPRTASVVYHGVSGREVESHPRSRSNPRRWLFVSNLSYYKNALPAVEAFRDLDDHEFRIVGACSDSQLARRLKQAVSGLPNVGWLGHVPPHQLGEHYRWADGLLWPSYAETFGHALALGCEVGMPVVAADAASNREIAGDSAEYFAPVRSPSAISNAVRRADKIDWTAREAPRRYTWESSVAHTVSVLRAAASGKLGM